MRVPKSPVNRLSCNRLVFDSRDVSFPLSRLARSGAFRHIGAGRYLWWFSKLTTGRSRFSETQIVGILKEADSGITVRELCRKHQISDAIYYKRKSKYGGLDASDVKRMRELEAENSQLKRMYAELSLENQALKPAAAGLKKLYGSTSLTTRGHRNVGTRLGIWWPSPPRRVDPAGVWGGGLAPRDLLPSRSHQATTPRPAAAVTSSFP